MAKKVLIADDSQTIRRAFEMTFGETSGVEIFGAGDAGSALSVAREQAPDLIIVDSNLGSTTGYELCKQIKADGQIRSIPVWIMTGPAERLDDDMYADCGADGHVRKPFDTQRMLDKVAAMSAPPDEEMSRPSYPPAAARPEVAVKPPAAAAAVDKRPRQATLMGGMGGPVAPPVKPKPAEPPPPKAPPPRPEAPPPRAPEPIKPAPEPRAPQPAPARAAVDVDAADMTTPVASAALEGLSAEQREAVMALVREVVEKTVWEVVPDMAEALIREEIARLLKD